MDAENGLKLNLCLTCRRRLLTCVCQYLRPLETHSRFVILMHPMEFKKEKVGTGRFSNLILKNSEIIVDVCFDENRRFLQVLEDKNYQTVILYPGEQTIDLSKAESAEKLGTKPLQFLALLLLPNQTITDPRAAPSSKPNHSHVSLFSEFPTKS